MPGRELAPEASVWQLYVEEAKEYDNELVKSENDNLDLMLLFVGILLIAGFRVLRLASVSTYIWSISEGSARISTSTWEKPFEMTAPRSVSTSVSCFVPQEI